jgi:Domain of unknown function (DUF4397)
MASSVKNLFFPLSAATVAFVAASWLSAPSQLSATGARATKAATLAVDSSTSTPPSTPGSLPDSPSGLAQIRVSQWAADRPAIDVSLDGKPWESNLRSPASGAYISVSAGRHRVVIAAADDKPGADETSGVSVDLRLESGARATLFPRPLGMTPGAILISDVIPKEVTELAHLRVINLSEQQSTLWAIGGKDLEVAADQRKSSGYVVAPIGEYTVRIASSKTADPIIQRVPISADQGDMVTVMITDAGPSIDAVAIKDHRTDSDHAGPGPTLPTDDSVPDSVPESTLTSTPDTTTPDTISPDTTTPDTISPDTTTPDTTTPDTTTPDTTTPDTTSPDTTVSVNLRSVPTSSSPLATPDQLALEDRGTSRSTGDALINALEGAGVALAVSEFVRRARRRSA